VDPYPDLDPRIHASDKWIRIQEAQKHVDPVDPDPDSDPQHCLKLTLLLSSSPMMVMTRSGSVVSFDFWDSWMKDPLFSYWTRVPTNQERSSSVRISKCTPLLFLHQSTILLKMA
jgi:hypothetical protein